MKINEYSTSTTEDYCAPELSPKSPKRKKPKLDKDNKKEYDSNLQIDITKSLSYICG